MRLFSENHGIISKMANKCTKSAIVRFSTCVSGAFVYNNMVYDIVG